jgi:hypothetical protein
MDGFGGGFSLQGNAVRKSSENSTLPILKSGMRMSNNAPNNNQQMILQSRPINSNQRLTNNKQLAMQSGPETDHTSQSMDDRINSLQMNQKPQTSNGTPVTMRRAKVWTVDVENAYRFQLAGFQNESEYLSKYPRPGICMYICI